jgi:hypothetical protein
MVAYIKFECFTEDLAKKVHDLHTDTLRVYLSNAAPNVATHTVKANIADLSTANGYTAGGIDIQNTVSRTGGISSILVVDVAWTATGGSFGPFRYAIIYNDNPTSPADPLIGYYDYGSSISINDTETFTVDFGSSLFTVT